MISVGDLVLPANGREFLYTTPEKVECEEDPMDMFWDDNMPGIVVEVSHLDPPQEYYQIRIAIVDAVGWTYSDYVKVIPLKR